MSQVGTPRIGLNAMTAVLGGGITAARQLTLALAKERPDWQLVLYYAHPDVLPPTLPANLEPRFLPLGVRPLRRWWWEQWKLPGVLARDGCDLLLSIGGYACFATRVPQVSIWQNPNVLSRLPVKRSLATESYIRFQRLVQRLSMTKSRMNVFQTWDSVEMACSRFFMQNAPHTAIHWGFEPPSSNEAPPSLDARDPFLVVAVGHTYYHKNYELLIEGAARYAATYSEPLKVVVAGGPYDAQHYEGLVAKAREAGGHVEFLGAITAAEVVSLYRRARAYVTTSLLETFGLTSLEAMGHGVPVVAAKASCHPEVCGDAALYFDPGDPDDLAARLKDVLGNSEISAGLRTRGLERVQAFPWSKTGAAYAETLEQVMEAARG